MKTKTLIWALYITVNQAGALNNRIDEWGLSQKSSEMHQYRRRIRQALRFKDELFKRANNEDADLAEAMKTAQLVKQISDQRAELARGREEKLRKELRDERTQLAHADGTLKRLQERLKEYRRRFKSFEDEIFDRRKSFVGLQERYEYKAKCARAWKRAAKHWYLFVSGCRNQDRLKTKSIAFWMERADIYYNAFINKARWAYAWKHSAKDQRIRAELAERERDDLRRRLDMMRGHALKAMDERDGLRRRLDGLRPITKKWMDLAIERMEILLRYKQERNEARRVARRLFGALLGYYDTLDKKQEELTTRGHCHELPWVGPPHEMYGWWRNCGKRRLDGMTAVANHAIDERDEKNRGCEEWKRLYLIRLDEMADLIAKNIELAKQRDEARRVARLLYRCAKNERRDGNAARSAFIYMMQKCLEAEEQSE